MITMEGAPGGMCLKANSVGRVEKELETKQAKERRLAGGMF